MSHIDEQNESTKGGVDGRGAFSFDMEFKILT